MPPPAAGSKYWISVFGCGATASPARCRTTSAKCPFVRRNAAEHAIFVQIHRRISGRGSGVEKHLQRQNVLVFRRLRRFDGGFRGGQHNIRPERSRQQLVLDWVLRFGKDQIEPDDLRPCRPQAFDQLAMQAPWPGPGPVDVGE